MPRGNDSRTHNRHIQPTIQLYRPVQFRNTHNSSDPDDNCNNPILGIKEI